MIISVVELRQPHHYTGQLRHAYRRRDGYDITVVGSLVYVMHLKSGCGVMFPVNDVLTATTEPDPVLPQGVVEVSLEDEITEPAPTLPAPKKPAARR
jgi:hypothetical protein